MVSIVIVNYNTNDVLNDCLSSIRQYENGNYEIIVVDNASHPENQNGLQNTCKNFSAELVLIDKQISFSAANNIGFERSKGDFVLFMNPDIIFTEPLLVKLCDLLVKDTGAVSPMLVGTDGKFQRNYFQRYPSVTQFIMFHSMFAKPFFKSRFLMNKFLENQDIEKSKLNVVQVEQIPFAFFMTKRNIFTECGKMDESYELFFEDMDISFQIGKKYALKVDKSLQVTHLGGSSFKTADNWKLFGRFIMSMIYFFDKNYSRVRSFILKILAFCNSVLIITFEKLKTLFGKKDEYRIKKHSHFLKLYKAKYL